MSWRFGSSEFSAIEFSRVSPALSIFLEEVREESARNAQKEEKRKRDLEQAIRDARSAEDNNDFANDEIFCNLFHKAQIKRFLHSPHSTNIQNTLLQFYSPQKKKKKTDSSLSYYSKSPIPPLPRFQAFPSPRNSRTRSIDWIRSSYINSEQQENRPKKKLNLKINVRSLSTKQSDEEQSKKLRLKELNDNDLSERGSYETTMFSSFYDSPKEKLNTKFHFKKVDMFCNSSIDSSSYSSPYKKSNLLQKKNPKNTISSPINKSIDKIQMWNTDTPSDSISNLLTHQSSFKGKSKKNAKNHEIKFDLKK